MAASEARLLAAPEAAEASWGFHVQQAIEKALKAWIISLDGTAPFTHDIADLLECLRRLNQSVDRFSGFSCFTVFAVQLRYDDEPDPLHLDRERWHQSVEALLTEVSLGLEG